jgi:hypothetical protein
MVSIELSLAEAMPVPGASFPIAYVGGSAVGVQSLRFSGTDDANDACQWSVTWEGYSSGGTLRVQWYADSALSGDVLFGGSVVAVSPNDDATDMEALAWGTEATQLDSHLGTEGQRLHETIITLDGLGSAADGDLGAQMLRRITTAANTDTLSGDVHVVGVWLEYESGAGSPPMAAMWSEASTWGGSVPTTDEAVTIAEGETVYLDTATASLGALTISGTLIADYDQAVAITASRILITGTGELRIGTAATPFANDCTITLTGARSTHTERDDDTGLDNDGMSRSIMVQDGGIIQIHGTVPAVTVTKLNAHAAASATTLTTADATGWLSGDRIAISKTDFYDVGDTESFVLGTNASGTTVTLPSGLVTPRWGVLQYPVDAAVHASGISLTAGTFTPPDPLTPTVLDERATLINLSRNIKIQGADDTAWSTDGWGAHVMVMGSTSVAKVSGVEFLRVGQRRAIGRYPFHWHMNSYNSGTGAFVADKEDDYLTDCAIWGSENRAITVHGTCGVEVARNNIFDINGHAIFVEDGSERRNTIDANVVMRVRDPGSAGRIKIHDTKSASIAFSSTGSSGIWLTNPDNTCTNNQCSDCDGRGIWNSFATECFGLSSPVALNPNSLAILLHEDNNCHSNFTQGIVTEFVVTNEAGNTAAQRYEAVAPVLSRNKVWKNRGGGYLNRVKNPEYRHWTAADNDGKDFAGQSLIASGVPALLVAPLCIAESGNNATAFTSPPRNAFASYHWALDIKEAVAIGYHYSEPIITSTGQFTSGGGAFSLNDVYLFSIGARQTTNNIGWLLIDSHAGYVTPPPYFDPFAVEYPTSSFRFWSMAVTIDEHGYWGSPGDYMVWDDPFFTHGLSSSTTDADQGDLILTPDRFFGLDSWQIDSPTLDRYDYAEPGNRVRVAHLNSSFVEVGVHDKGDTNDSAFYGQLGGIAVHNGGIYLVTFPDGPLPTTYITVFIHNAYRAVDSVLIGVPWPNGVVAKGRLDSSVENDSVYSEATRITNGWTRIFDFSTATSAADVLADTTGETAWQDTTNNTVWVLIVGGLAYPSSYNSNEGSTVDDDYLTKPMTLRLAEDI